MKDLTGLIGREDLVDNLFTRMQTPTTTPVAGLKMVMNQIPFGVC